MGNIYIIELCGVECKRQHLTVNVFMGFFSKQQEALAETTTSTREKVCM